MQQNPGFPEEEGSMRVHFLLVRKIDEAARSD